MQKKFIYAAAPLMLGLVLSPMFVHAQTLNTSASVGVEGTVRVGATRPLMGEGAEAMRTRFLQNKEALKERAAELRVQAQARLNAGAERSIGNIIDMLSRAVDRLEYVATKADAHIERFEAAGADMSGSAALLVEARADIGDAQVKVDAVAAALEVATASETPREEMAAVRTAVQAAKEALRVARESLKAVLQSIRTEGASVQVDASAEVEASANTQ